GKFDGKANEGYIVGYSASNRAYRGLGHEWYFNLDYLTDTLGYKRDKANQSAGTQEASTNPAGTQDADSDSECDEQVIIELARLKGQEQRATSDAKDAEELHKRASAKIVPTGSIPVPSGDTTISLSGVPVPTGSSTDSFFDYDPTTRFPTSTVEVSPVATKRINTIHPQSLIIGDHTSTVQTRSKVDAMPEGKYAIGTKWILKNKRDARGIVAKNKARLVAQGHRQEEGIDYDEVFALVARIEVIRLFLAFASYMGFMVYQMDVKSAFLYGRIDEEVYV
ncbi:putative ribonuclease H-like domain-containing protein, partial [Tanacetum coccineum]